MDVVRDVLDKHIVDRHGREMGRVDGIVVDVRTNEPPVLSDILIGISALGHRLHPIIGRWAHGLEYGLGLGAERPVRIGFPHVSDIGEKVRIDLGVGETAADSLEQRLRTWLVKIPGSK